MGGIWEGQGREQFKLMLLSNTINLSYPKLLLGGCKWFLVKMSWKIWGHQLQENQILQECYPLDDQGLHRLSACVEGQKIKAGKYYLCLQLLVQVVKHTPSGFLEEFRWLMILAVSLFAPGSAIAPIVASIIWTSLVAFTGFEIEVYLYFKWVVELQVLDN